MMMRRVLVLAGVLAAILSPSSSGQAFANEELAKLASEPSNWAMQSGDFANQRYSALKQVNKSNAKTLSVAWTFSTGVLRGHEGGPLVVGDTLYVHSPYPNKVFAISLEDQTIKWKYEPKQDASVIPVMCCDLVSKGVAYAEGKIFLQQADTTLVALDAKTGKEVWKVKTGDPRVGTSSTNAPHIFKDKVITGMAGGEFGVRGYITAYDINTGKQVWRGYSAGPDEDMLMDPNASMTWTNGKMAPVGKDSSLKTWLGDQWKIAGGATWGWYSYDPALNLLYYGSGNPSTWNPKQRPGDNKWSMTVWARDVDTGKVKWVYQMTPHDQWDYDGINEMILADMKVHGKDRKALVHFDRNGFAYTLDRATGELLTAQKFDPTVNWASHVDMKTGRPVVVAKYSTEQNGEDVTTKGICPTAQGSKNFVPAAFNPKNHLFYVPTNHMCMTYEPFKVEYTAGQPYVGATLTMAPAVEGAGMGNFIVWDADAGKIVQSKAEQFSVWSGALVTAGGIACYGTLEGYLKCVDADDVTKELFKFKTPSGIIGNVNTWEYKGRQYIGVLSGIGGWAGIGLADPGLKKATDGLGAVGAYKGLSQYTEQGGVLTVFAVPAEVTASR
jgi:PQQ-dependent dehydrogenase (methanol/ethanol family)